MRKIVKRGSSDIIYRTEYNKRDDVKIIRKKYMKERNKRNSQESRNYREMMENPEIRKLMRKTGK